jgi:signal-transduction protein with cAMP-binding, CBS, and nucleotidyltransferase domain
MITYKNIMRWSFEKNPSLSKLSGLQIERVMEGLKMKNYKKGDKIFSKGDSCTVFLIVLEGKIEKVWDYLSIIFSFEKLF